MMTALERFEQAFGPSYARKGYDAIQIQEGAVLYFRRGFKNRNIARINLKRVWNFPNGGLLAAYLRGTEDAIDYCIGPEHWDHAIELMQR